MVDINVNQYGDELLTLYTSGEHEAALDMWTTVQKATVGFSDASDGALQTLIALHKYENERIADKTVGFAVVDCCHTLAAQGHPKFSRLLNN